MTSNEPSPGNAAADPRSVGDWSRRLRRLGFFGIVGLSTVLAVWAVFRILAPNGLTAVEAAIIALFAVNFGWITISFWTAAAGFVLRLAGLDPITLARRRRIAGRPAGPIRTRTAIVMPICHEDVARVLAGLEATYRSVAATGELRHFDFYVLSDSSDPATARQEEAGWAALVGRLDADGRIFYRRRERRTGRKAGNVADFCCRWGTLYEHMVVLDADSVMTGDTILALVRAMQSCPAAGIVQTAPMPARQETPFGRFVQFAASLSGPMLSTGLSFWQLGECNYWGHNAIIRIEPFMRHCALPSLPGEAPLGGEILSHDFVESALMRRAGWDVFLLDDLEGSYEEVPSNVLDYAKRDRRWAQGNLQHLRLFGLRGLHGLSRFNFVLGALAYGSSLVWLMLLVLGSADALMRAVMPHDFFGDGRQLYPDWQIVETGRIHILLAVTAALLVLPKLWSVLLCLGDGARRRAFGGGLRVVGSALLELVFSMLLAPLMMTVHSFFVVSILSGRTVSWGAQARSDRRLTQAEAARAAAVRTLIGLVWGVVTFWLAPLLFWWLTPVVVGLVLSVPLLHVSSKPSFGRRLRRAGLFLTPEETRPPGALAAVERAMAEIAPALDRPPALAPVRSPPELARPMPPQPLDLWSLRGLVAGRRAAADSQSA